MDVYSTGFVGRCKGFLFKFISIASTDYFYTNKAENVRFVDYLLSFIFFLASVKVCNRYIHSIQCPITLLFHTLIMKAAQHNQLPNQIYNHLPFVLLVERQPRCGSNSSIWVTFMGRQSFQHIT